MKPHIPRLILLLTAILFILSVFHFGAALPARVATHFDGAGLPNGWMTRSAHLLSFSMLGLGSSLFILVLTALMRFLPASMLNVPHADYWRSPEHYPEACAYLHRHSYGFATLLLLWFGALHVLIVEANRHTPPRMNSDALWILMPGLLVAVAVWAFTLIRHFYNVPKA